MKSKFQLLGIFLCIFSYSGEKCYSAGGVGFGCECFEHRNAIVPPGLPVGANNALVNYIGIQGMHGAIMPAGVAPGGLPIMPAGGGLPIMPAGGPIVAGVNDWVSFCVAGGIPPVWAPPIACSFSSALGALPAILPGALTYQQKAQMVLDRESIGIPVKFLLGLVIGAVALGMPVVPGGLVEQYLKRAFGGGGYSSPMAIMLYRLRYNPIVFPFLGLPGGGMPTLVVLHIRIPCRVSKNMKELHCNSFSDPVTVNQAGPAPFIPPPPAVPPPPGAYVSIKFNIDNIWAGLGLLPPSSATVVSYDAVPKK